jgi:hypothetical protein
MSRFAVLFPFSSSSYENKFPYLLLELWGSAYSAWQKLCSERDSTGDYNSEENAEGTFDLALGKGVARSLAEGRGYEGGGYEGGFEECCGCEILMTTCRML